MPVAVAEYPLRVRAARLRAGPRPADVFPLLASRDGCFFLDSSGADPVLAQWSFIGCGPFLTISAAGDRVTERDSVHGRTRRANPFSVLARTLARYSVETDPDTPPFTGGAVGFFGYDLKHFIELLPRSARRDSSIPDMHFAFYDSLLAYDHRADEWHALVLEAAGDRTPSGKSVKTAMSDLTRLVKTATPAPPPDPVRAFKGDIRSNFARDDYLRTVERAHDYIAAGDIFQVNLSQRFETQLTIPPPQLARVLRSVNPAPFAAFLAADDWAVVSSSPERFLLLRDGHVSTRPIKGTRRRTGDEDRDRLLRRELLASPKDRAELVMIVDLERNDLGRVCDYGSVRVTQPVVLEEHPTVYHLVATVEGDLHAGVGPVDLIKASFPGGSITGAPKVRSMEIIDELEPTARNLYTGSIGYIGFNGEMDLNIVIRTFLVQHSRLTFQVGGGIVADSSPQAEYDETLHKGRALFRALGYSGEWSP